MAFWELNSGRGHGFSAWAALCNCTKREAWGVNAKLKASNRLVSTQGHSRMMNVPSTIKARGSVSWSLAQVASESADDVIWTTRQ